MNWIASIARILGVTNPITAMAVQVGAERDSRQIQERLRRFEDPISSLDPDVRSASELLYQGMAKNNSPKVVLSEGELARYARVLAVLEAAGRIRGSHAIGRRFAAGLWLADPTYILYMAALYEDQDLMERFVARVDATPGSTWLNGDNLAEEFALPVPVVRAVFDLYAQRGLGLLSKVIGVSNYYAQVRAGHTDSPEA